MTFSPRVEDAANNSPDIRLGPEFGKPSHLRKNAKENLRPSSPSSAPLAPPKGLANRLQSTVRDTVGPSEAHPIEEVGDSSLSASSTQVIAITTSASPPHFLQKNLQKGKSVTLKNT